MMQYYNDMMIIICREGRNEPLRRRWRDERENTLKQNIERNDQPPKEKGIDATTRATAKSGDQQGELRES